MKNKLKDKFKKNKNRGVSPNLGARLVFIKNFRTVFYDLFFKSED